MIEAMPDGDALIVIWFKLLTLAGQVNEGGMLVITADIPYTEQLLASQFGRPIATVQLALRTFEQLGMIEVVDDIIRVSNWERYQNVDGMERIREQTRNRVAKHREAKRLEACNVTCNATVTQCNADRNKNKRIEIESREEEPRNSEREIQEETIDKSIVKKKFTPPTVEEVSDYCYEQNLGIDPEAFVDYYNANGWMIGGKAHMKDWRAAARNWDRKRKADKSNPNSRYLTKGEQARKDMDDFYQMTREWVEESTNDASGIR